MYKFTHIFTQSPEKVKVTVLAVGGVICGLMKLNPTLLETVGIGIAVERVLDLFYVAPVKAQQQEELALRGIQLGKELQGARRRG